MRHSIDSQWARVLRPAPLLHLLLEKHLHVVHYTLHCILYNSMSMQVMYIGLGDEVLVRTLWVKSLWSIDSLAGASVSLFSHGIVTWPMIPTSDKKRQEPPLFLKSELWFRQGSGGKIYEIEFVHFGCRRIWSSLFRARSAEITWVFHELQYSGHVRLNSRTHLFSRSVYGRCEQAQQAGAACWSGCTCCGGILGLGLLQKLSFIYLLLHIMEIWL